MSKQMRAMCTQSAVSNEMRKQNANSNKKQTGVQALNWVAYMKCI